ncbi:MULTISPECIES: hypothetical protein [Providencia]|uniref:Wzy n=1 Tax=Providencia rustigianii TaxID=158850 RepID=A0A346CLH2_9GAMM|nr:MULTISPECIES: hypothetical protein [Providencia]AXL96446.1 Wzy [Providencia rustigianii]MTC55628.1 hypothetical protein [Providencia rustigianii]
MEKTQNLSINPNKIHSVLYYFLFFIAGFNYLLIFAILIITCSLLEALKLKNSKIKTQFIVSSIIFFFYILLTFFIGADRFYTPSPFNAMTVILISTLYLGLILQSKTNIEKRNLISMYIIGLAAQSLFIVAYNYMQGENYGYGNLLNPFTGNKMNSPSISNNLALSLSLSLFYVFNFKMLVKLASILLTLLMLLCGFYLSGRTFFLISLIALIMLFIHNFKIKNIFYFILLIIPLGFISTYILPDNIHKHIEFTLSRLSEGLESNRFKHYYYGLSELPNYPFGGFIVDSSIEKTLWFHNIFLDTARVAGWIPTFLLAMFTIISLTRYLYYRKNAFTFFGLYIFLITFIIMQQDVIVEGEYRILIIFFLSTLMFIKVKDESLK